MDIEAKIKDEKKYFNYAIWLFSILMYLQLGAYMYGVVKGENVAFPYTAIIVSSIAIFCFRYIHSLIYLFGLLNRLEEREVRRAVRAREKNKLTQKKSMNKSQKRGVIFFTFLALLMLCFQSYDFFIKGNDFDFVIILLSVVLIVFCYFYKTKPNHKV